MAAISASEYAEHDAIALAGLVRAGDATPAELLESAIARAEERADLNAIAHLMPMDEVMLATDRQAALSGVPFLLKDISVQVAGMALTMGSELLSGNVCVADDTLTQRFRAAGLSLFGRTVMAELGMRVVTDPCKFGPTVNPWNPGRNAGGSSGGAAAAVAAGIVPVAHATDAFGSIRVPARLRVPGGPGIGEALAGLGNPHCVSFSVRDSAALLDAVQGADIGDAYASPPAAANVAALERPPRRVRIACWTGAPDRTPVASANVLAVEEMAEHLASLGHHVEQAELIYDGSALSDAIRVLAGTTSAMMAKRRMQALGATSLDGLLEPASIDWIERAEAFTAADFQSALHGIHQIGRAVGSFFQAYDAYLTPVTAERPMALSPPRPSDLAGLLAQNAAHAPFTAVYNAGGCPAMSVPSGFDAQGLPLAVQIGAAFGKEARLFSLAAEIERTKPWRRAPLHMLQTFTA